MRADPRRETRRKEGSQGTGVSQTAASLIARLSVCLAFWEPSL